MDSLSSKIPSRISLLTDAEVDLELQNWRKCAVDFETLAIVETMDPGTFSTTCFMPPMVTSTVFNTSIECRLANGPIEKPLHVYSRVSNPTREHLETALAKFDGAKYALAFSSGQAASVAVFQACSTNDHIIYVQSISGDTDRFLKDKLPTFGIVGEEVRSRDAGQITSFINKRTRIIMLECPSNPTLEMADIQAISTQAKRIKPDVLIIVDNTIMTPIFQRPLDLGADVVVYSLTKYFGGHSDIVMGSLSFNSDALYESYKDCQRFLGAIPSPLDCYLMIRSLKTFPLRMKKHFRSAMKIAHFLETHPAIIKVFYPGLKSHSQYDLVRAQMSGASGLMSFYIKGSLPEAVKFIKELKYFRHGGSFASDVSMVTLPTFTSQRAMSSVDRQNLGIGDHLIRISVGLEGVERLAEDLDQALLKATGEYELSIPLTTHS